MNSLTKRKKDYWGDLRDLGQENKINDIVDCKYVRE
jgi:hypothetical protein